MITTRLFILIFGLSLNVVFAQDSGTNEKTAIGEGSFLVLPRIQVIPIKDTQNERLYELYIKLPESYTENSETRYPVLYITDAIWHIEILSAATEYIIEDIILVGISWQKDISEDLINENGEHVSRYRDYSVLPSNNPEHQAKYQFGQASNHLAFIRNDVIEYVEDNYRTDPSNRSYFGYSAGGVFGAYTLLTQPNTFKNYILGSPALRGDIPYFSALESNGELNTNVFISYGSLEDDLGEHAEEFITLLENRKSQSLSLEHAVIEGSHQTAFPMTGVQSVGWLSELVKE